MFLLACLLLFLMGGFFLSGCQTRLENVFEVSLSFHVFVLQVWFVKRLERKEAQSSLRFGQRRANEKSS